MSKPQMNTRKLWLLAALAASASAQQTIRVPQVAQVRATISLHEPTLLLVQGRKLLEVKAWSDELQLLLDQTQGRATILVAAPQAPRRAFSLQASDDAGGTYVFSLTAQDVPGELIVLQPQAGGAPLGGAVSEYARAIKNLLLQMARGADDDSQPLLAASFDPGPAWRLTPQREFVAPALRGEQYRLANASAQAQALDEAAFYRPGVLAVALEQSLLAPGASTALYIVRGSDD